ncbi:MAG: putative membrane protein YkoI [Sulfitobacter sp.]|jgi:uncharacterized membrane protein YkoI
MNRKTILKLGTSALLSLGLVAGAATMAAADSHADKSDAAEAQTFLAAPGSIAAAITAAEEQSGGKAMSADFETDGADAGWYDVEVVMADGTMTELLVNPADGTVKAAPADDMDGHDNDGETDDDGSKNESN